MTGPMMRLLRLSQLMADAAEREVMRCGLAVRQATAALEDARLQAQQLRDKIAEQKAQTRELFMGATHARHAVELLMSDLAGFDAAEVAAERRIEAAESARDSALATLKEAQGALRKAVNKVDRRQSIVMQQARRAEIARETLEEADALDQWTGVQTGWRAG